MALMEFCVPPLSLAKYGCALSRILNNQNYTLNFVLGTYLLWQRSYELTHYVPRYIEFVGLYQLTVER